MRILHILSTLPPAGASAVTRLMHAQREDGLMVAAASMPAFGDAPGDGDGLRQFVDQALGGADSFDVIHAHGTAAVPVTLALDGPGPDRAPVMVTLHDWVSEEGVRTATVHAGALRLADLVTAPSALAASLVTTLGVEPQRVRTIPYVVDAAPALTAEEAAHEREFVAWRMRGGEVIAAVSYGASGRHHEAALRAMTFVSRADALMCVLAGDVDVDACRRLADSLGVAERVRVCAPHLNARALSARCDYLALPSFDERRPFTLAEAWCDGVPVLAGRNAQFSGMDAQGHGTVFFDPQDPLDLARAIASVRSTTPTGRRMLVERARAQYRQHYTAKAVFDAYMSEYRALLVARHALDARLRARRATAS